MLPYVEAYYPGSPAEQGVPITLFPAVTASYIKFSPVTAVVSGQATRPTKVDSVLGSAGLGVKLRIGALYSLFKIPADELTNQVVWLNDLLGTAAVEIVERIAEETTFSAQVQRFEQLFLERMGTNSDSTGLIEQEAVAVLQQEPRFTVSRLAQAIGYSPRQLQRKLNTFTGLSPRLFRRISRFEKALELIQALPVEREPDWSSIALACGYSDQAHFIREFREFAGCTPTGYLIILQTV